MVLYWIALSVYMYQKWYRTAHLPLLIFNQTLEGTVFTWVPSRYRYSLSSYKIPYHKDKTVVRQSRLYNENQYIGNTTSLYWGGPQPNNGRQQVKHTHSASPLPYHIKVKQFEQGKKCFSIVHIETWQAIIDFTLTIINSQMRIIDNRELLC